MFVLRKQGIKQMNAYSIFDDFSVDAADVLKTAGVELTIHPRGVPRPSSAEMKSILEQYDCVIIGTTQKMHEDMFENIESPRIIATASVGLSHIHIPQDKEHLITVINTPKANAQSVAEYTIGCILACYKRLVEGRILYLSGRDNKKLYHKPEDMAGKKLGVIGAGNISAKIMDYAIMLGMQVACWTAHPESHPEISSKGVAFSDLEELIRGSDVISVNLPDNAGTKKIMSSERVQMMRDDAVFVSVSRADTVDYRALFEKAKDNPGFYVCLDLDLNDDIIRQIPDIPNVMVTPHIAGGTVESRKRMFRELAEMIVKIKGDMK